MQFGFKAVRGSSQLARVSSTSTDPTPDWGGMADDASGKRKRGDHGVRGLLFEFELMVPAPPRLM